MEPWPRRARALRKNYGIEAQAEAGPSPAAQGTVVLGRQAPNLSRTLLPRPRRTRKRPAPERGGRHPLLTALPSGSPPSAWCAIMPSYTPALVGKGMSALYVCPAVTAAERQSVKPSWRLPRVSCGVESEKQLDAVTALWAPGPRMFSTRSHDPRGVGMGLSGRALHTSWP